MTAPSAPAPLRDPGPAAAAARTRIEATMPVPVSVAVVLGSGIKALEDLVGGGSVSYGELVGSSRVDLQACKLEYSIVSPK